jgi:hypothetical protein
MNNYSLLIIFLSYYSTIIAIWFLTIMGMTLWLPKSVHLKVATLAIIPCLFVNAWGLFALSIGAISSLKLTVLSTVTALGGTGVAIYVLKDKISQNSKE